MSQICVIIATSYEKPAKRFIIKAWIQAEVIILFLLNIFLCNYQSEESINSVAPPYIGLYITLTMLITAICLKAC